MEFVIKIIHFYENIIQFRCASIPDVRSIECTMPFFASHRATGVWVELTVTKSNTTHCNRIFFDKWFTAGRCIEFVFVHLQSASEWRIDGARATHTLSDIRQPETFCRCAAYHSFKVHQRMKLHTATPTIGNSFLSLRCDWDTAECVCQAHHCFVIRLVLCGGRSRYASVHRYYGATIFFSSS